MSTPPDITLHLSAVVRLGADFVRTLARRRRREALDGKPHPSGMFMTARQFLLGGIVAGIIANLRAAAVVWSLYGRYPFESLGVSRQVLIVTVASRCAIGFGLLWVFLATRRLLPKMTVALPVSALAATVLIFFSRVDPWFLPSYFHSWSNLLEPVWVYLEVSLAMAAAWLVTGWRAHFERRLTKA